MQQPRELLNARHAAAEPRLDALRRAVIAGQIPRPSLPRPGWQQVWHEVFVAGRHTWCGLAAIWLLIAVWELAPTTRHPHSAPTVARELRNSIASQRELLRAELGAGEPILDPQGKRPRPPSGRIWKRREGHPRATTLA